MPYFYLSNVSFAVFLENIFFILINIKKIKLKVIKFNYQSRLKKSIKENYQRSLLTKYAIISKIF